MVVLFMTLGTGSANSVKNLAHGLAHSIININPTRIIFFGSEKSRKTLKFIEEWYQKKKGDDLPHYEFVEINSVDDFNECFEKIKSELERYNHEEVVIDYTSGTKTMTVSAAIASFIFHKRLNLVSGTRGNNGLVILGTERNIEQTLYSAYDRLLFEQAKTLFNHYRFDQAKDILDQIVILENKEMYEKIFEAYSLWDRFRHEKAFEHIEDVTDERVNRNRGFLGQVVNATDRYQKYKLLLADLINNAKRRIEEGKYDDAVARLYRAMELISQIKLLEYGIDDIEKAISLESIKDRVDVRKYEMYSRDGKLLLGLEKKYQLLNDLGWDAEKYYTQVRNNLTKRNESILAHGLKSVSYEDAMEFYEQVRQISVEIFGIDRMLRDSEFPKL